MLSVLSSGIPLACYASLALKSKILVMLPFQAHTTLSQRAEMGCAGAVVFVDHTTVDEGTGISCDNWQLAVVTGA